MHETLEFLVRAEPEHFFATTGGIFGFQIGVDRKEERFEFKRSFPGKDSRKLLSYPIWTPT